MLQPWPSQLTLEMVGACGSAVSNSTRIVTSSPHVGLIWCDSPWRCPSDRSTNPRPCGDFAWSRMTCWYICSNELLMAGVVLLRYILRWPWGPRETHVDGTCAFSVH